MGSTGRANVSPPISIPQVWPATGVPESVIVLGGGVVACELAQYLARIGSRVTQIQRSPHVLKGHAEDAAHVIEQAFRDEGIRLFTGTRLVSVAFDGAEYEVVFEQAGKRHIQRARHCLNALGRVPTVDPLNPAAAGGGDPGSRRGRTRRGTSTARADRARPRPGRIDRSLIWPTRRRRRSRRAPCGRGGSGRARACAHKPIPEEGGGRRATALPELDDRRHGGNDKTRGQWLGRCG